MVVEGKLRLNWTYSPGMHKRETVEVLAGDTLSALEQIIDHCQSPEAGGYTPSDFPDIHLDQGDIDAILEEIDDSLFD
jgi:microcystin synthetase protein McyA